MYVAAIFVRAAATIVFLNRSSEVVGSKSFIARDQLVWCQVNLGLQHPTLITNGSKELIRVIFFLPFLLLLLCGRKDFEPTSCLSRSDVQVVLFLRFTNGFSKYPLLHSYYYYYTTGCKRGPSNKSINLDLRLVCCCCCCYRDLDLWAMPKPKNCQYFILYIYIPMACNSFYVSEKLCP